MREEVRSARDRRRAERQQVLQHDQLVLRDYQQQTVDAVLKAIDEGIDRMSVEAPTGSGKTTTMMYIIHQLWARGNNSQEPVADRERGQVLILVPGIQIAVQIKMEAERILRGQLGNRCTIDLEQGDWRSDGMADLTVATWQGLHSSDDRIGNYDPLTFELVVVDECHHAASPWYKNGHRVKLLGMSATPDRTDGYDIEDAFPTRVWTVDVMPLMKASQLSPLLYAPITGLLDVEKMLEDGESVEEASLAEEGDNIDEEEEDLYQDCNKAIVQQHKLRSDFGRRFTLVFCKRLKQVWSLKGLFAKEGIAAEAVTGKTPREIRTHVLQNFQAGLFPCLINCGALMEGTDLPCIDLLVIARPTRSRICIAQMMGRGMRKSIDSGKQNCLILDYTVSPTTGLHTFPDLYALVKVVGSKPAVADPAWLESRPRSDVPYRSRTSEPASKKRRVRRRIESEEEDEDEGDSTASGQQHDSNVAFEVDGVDSSSDEEAQSTLPNAMTLARSTVSGKTIARKTFSVKRICGPPQIELCAPDAASTSSSSDSSDGEERSARNDE